MKCKKCGAGAVIELRRHNTAFCTPGLPRRSSATRSREAVRHYHMLARDERVLVAVSGGKDSLALWDVLLEDGYETSGLYLDLGIFEYSAGVEGEVPRLRGRTRRASPRLARWPRRSARRCP